MYLSVQYHSADMISATDTQRLESAQCVFNDTLYKIPFAGLHSARAVAGPSTLYRTATAVHFYHR